MPERHLLKRSIRHAFDRAAASYDAAALVQRDTCRLLADFAARHPVQRAVRRTLDAGCGTGYGLGHVEALYPGALHVALDFAPAMLARLGPTLAAPVCADLEHLPLAAGSVDAVWSSLALQWCTPALAFGEIARVLAPGGGAWIATLGPRTLWELRQAFAAIDDAAHVIDFHPLPHWLDAARAAGLAIDADENVQTPALAPDLRTLLRDIKAIGAHTVTGERRRRPLGRQAWQRLERTYDAHRRADGLLPATYDLILLKLRKPA